MSSTDKIIKLEEIDDQGHCVFACGADTKNRFSFLKDGQIYLSEDNGDLADTDNFIHYLDSIKKMKAELGLSPDLVAHDLHPLYFSSKVGTILNNARWIGVQHHHAHIAGALAQSGQRDTVIGISFDGTGYGLDGNIWGGEFLVVTPEKWHRFGHLKYLKMPGGEMAVREPWRMAFALLYDYMGDSVFEKDFPFLKLMTKEMRPYLKNMIDRNVNTPLTSSCGRLFDAVSSLLGITHVNSFEAEAAINLEKKAALVADTHSYDFDIINANGSYIVDCKPLLKDITSDLAHGVPAENLARRFHNTLARLIVNTAKAIGRDSGTRTVVLSGGVFQNKLLYDISSELLKGEGFSLLKNRNVPVNDLGICIGQTVVSLKL